MKTMYNTNDGIKKYYMQNDIDNIVVSFNTINELIIYLARKTKYWFEHNHIKFDNLLKYQNLTGKDTYSYWHYIFQYNNVLDCYTDISNYELLNRPYYFYYETIDGKYHYFSIKPYLNEIKDMQSIVGPTRKIHYYRSFHPYQVRSKHYVNNALKDVYVEDEYKDYFLHTKPRHLKKFYKKYISRSERSWKKQTKMKHQYGNDLRNKFEESDFFKIDKEELDIM